MFYLADAFRSREEATSIIIFTANVNSALHRHDITLTKQYNEPPRHARF